MTFSKTLPQPLFTTYLKQHSVVHLKQLLLFRSIMADGLRFCYDIIDFACNNFFQVLPAYFPHPFFFVSQNLCTRFSYTLQIKKLFRHNPFFCKPPYSTSLSPISIAMFHFLIQFSSFLLINPFPQLYQRQGLILSPNDFSSLTRIIDSFL